MSDNIFDESNDPLIGKSIEGYEFVGRLGQGAFGAVYVARHPRLRREFAAKYIKLENPDELAQVQREIEILEKLKHPNVVGITDAYQFDNYQLIMMELVKGGSLRQTLQKLQGDMPDLRTILSLIDQVSSALDYVHSQTVLHLDLKPENILLEPLSENQPPRFVLTDFGISRFNRADGQLSNMAGTPRYMAPEQFDFEHARIDHHADIYALGIILYELIVGHVPFLASRLFELARQHLHDLPQPPGLLVPGLSPDVEKVILKALEKKPEDRFQSAAELNLALQAAAPGSVTQGKRVDAVQLGNIAQRHAHALDSIRAKAAPQTSQKFYLAVTGLDAQERIYVFQKSPVIIGRSSEADLVLQDDLISRRHAQIDFEADGKVFVTDLKSRHGVLINGKAITPEQRSEWKLNQYLSIRGFAVRFTDKASAVHLPATQRDVALSGQQVNSAAGIGQAEPIVNNVSPSQFVGLLDQQQEKHKQPRIRVTVSPEVVHVRSAHPYYLRVNVKPEGTPRTRYSLKILPGPGGIDETWYTLPAPKEIAPGEVGSFDMTITAPMVKSGTYEMFIGVVAEAPDIPDAAQIVKVVVEPTLKFSISLKPSVTSHSRLSWRRRARLNITNEGSDPQTFSMDVTAHDKLRVSPQTSRITIAEKESKTVGLALRPLRGAAQEGRLWYTVTVRSLALEGEKEETASYAFTPNTRPRIGLLGLIIRVLILIFIAYIALRLVSGTPPDVIFNDIRHLIETIIPGIKR